MKEKLLSLHSESDSSLHSGETSELENLDKFSEELGENDSLKSFNEEDFYKQKTSFLSQIFFWWTSPIFELSKTKNININTLKKTKKDPYNSSINCRDLFTPYHSLVEYYSSPNSKTHKNLLFSILRVNILDEFVVLVLSLSLTLLGIYRVNVFKNFMELFELKEENQFHPSQLYSISALILIVRFSQIIILHYNDYLCQKLCNKTRAQLTTLIYNKIINTAIFIKSNFNRGKIINFLQSDIETINFLFYYAPMTLVVPFQIAANIIFLFKLLGTSFIWSFITFLFLVAVAWSIEYFYIKTKKKLLKNNDDRIKATSSILQSIKVIKMYTYESLFYNTLKKKRENEMTNYKRIENIFVLTDFIHWLIPLFLSIISVGIEVLTKDNISIENIIVAIEIYDSLAYPLYRVPIFISSLLNTILSMKRLENFLDEENIEETKEKIGEEDETKLNRYVRYRDDDQYSIIIENTDFGIKGKKKEEDKVLLNDINIKIKKGSLVGILGETGSGKTNLVYGILRHFNIITDNEEDEYFTSMNLKYLNIREKKDTKVDINSKQNHNDDAQSIELSNDSFSSDEQEKKLEKRDSEIKARSSQRMVINGTISYACQIPFVINDTIKNNIQFYNKENPAKFWKVVEACQLSDDLKLFPANEYSEVSPGGSNLSGGQKARICLARAVFNDADIYILDDPISSVDPIVFNKIYGALLTNYLKDKTRIVLQHDHNFIQHMEYIYYINEGKIVFSGTYNEFINTKWYKKMISKETSHIEKILENSDTKLTVHKWKNLPSRKLSTVEGTKMAFIEKGKVVVEESTEKGGFKFSLYKKLFYVMGNKSYLLPFSLLIFSLCWQGLQVMSNYWLTQWTTKIENKNFDEKNQNTKRELHNAILYYYIIYCLIGSFSLFFLFLKEFLLTRALINISTLLHNDMVKQIIRAPINLFHDVVPLGRIINVLNFDLEKCKGIVKFYGNISRGIASLIASGFICWYYNKYSLYFIPILIICCVIFVNRVVDCTRDCNRVECVARTPILNNYNETLNGIVSIRAFNKEENFFNKLKKNVFEHYLIGVYNNGVNGWFLLYLDLLSFCYLVFIVLYLDYDYSISSAVSLGMLLRQTISFCEQLCFFFKQIGSIQNEMVHFERCEQYCNIVQENYYPSIPNCPYLKNKRFTITKPQIEFQKYSATYRGLSDIILKDINLIIYPKEKIGLVGRTGSGKSSLINAMFRIFEPQKGKILISGEDITHIPLTQLRKEICIVPQEPFLFDGTLRSNMDPKGNYDDYEIKKALDKVHFNWKLLGDKKDKRLDFHVSENGNNFSLGEKQLICFARAILQKKKIVIFDEATSNCDKSAERQMIKCIQNDFKDCTVIIIAHKLVNIMNCDRVLVLDKGRIKEFDSPITLYQTPGSAFKELCDNEKRLFKQG